MVFAVKVQFLWCICVSRYKAGGEQINSLIIVILLTALERSGFFTFSKTVLKADAKCKNHDELINYTVRVSTSSVFCRLSRINLRGSSPSF